jgi:hypothetical protein
MNFRKTILAASLSACAGAAIAADKTPTLGEVLKASDITASGYIDTTYTNFSTDVTSVNAHPYTNEKNSINLNAVDLAVSSLPASGFGGMVEMMAGTDVDFNRSRGWNLDNFDLLQAYMQYATGPFTVMGGKFVTLAGAEVAQAPANANISRSLLYTLAIPVTHTGLRASYAPGDTMKFTLGYNNGWDIIKDSAPNDATAGAGINCNLAGTNCADGKTVELGAAFTPIKQFSLSAMYHVGEEYSSLSDTIGTRKLLDIVATFNATDALTFVLNYDKAEQEKASATVGTAKWDGLAGYANYAFSEKWRGSLRLEQFNDKDCFRTGCPTSTYVTATPSELKLEEATLTVAYLPSKNAELRAEYRRDKSKDVEVFDEGGSAKKSQGFFGLEALYKF